MKNVGVTLPDHSFPAHFYKLSKFTTTSYLHCVYRSTKQCKPTYLEMRILGKLHQCGVCFIQSKRSVLLIDSPRRRLSTWSKKVVVFRKTFALLCTPLLRRLRTLPSGPSSTPTTNSSTAATKTPQQQLPTSDTYRTSAQKRKSLTMAGPAGTPSNHPQSTATIPSINIISPSKHLSSLI